ncbi:MAG: ATP-binding protein [Actinobacteria bacterium]|nr:MAG: ATP-binding protein [Actinomycetota bacterium]
MKFDDRTIVPDMRSFRAHPSALFEIRQFVREHAAAASLPEQMTNDLLLAVSEAAANSIIHTTTAAIQLSWARDGECVEIEVRDTGIFKKRVRIAEVEGRGGHGIPLMMALVDRLTIEEGTQRRPGTLVRLVKCRT